MTSLVPPCPRSSSLHAFVPPPSHPLLMNVPATSERGLGGPLPDTHSWRSGGAASHYHDFPSQIQFRACWIGGVTDTAEVVRTLRDWQPGLQWREPVAVL